MQPGLAEIRTSALWHLHNFSIPNGSFELRRIDPAQYRDASFLDQRIEKACKTAFSYPLQHVGKLFPPEQTARQNTHYIFHIGHCGSTLLSRLISASPAVLPVREPLALRALAAEVRLLGHDSLQQPPLAPVFSAVQASLGRGFANTQAVMVKATSTCNNLIAPLLEASADSHGIGMYVPLETYLAGMLGKLEPARDLRGHLPVRLLDWAALPNDYSLEDAALSEAQCAVLGWLTGMHRLLEAQVQFGERFQLLNFSDLLEQPQEILESLAGSLGLGEQAAVMQQAWPRLSGQYSKLTSHPYTPADRERTLQRGRQLRAADVAAGLAWAEELVQTDRSLHACTEYF